MTSLRHLNLAHQIAVTALFVAFVAFVVAAVTLTGATLAGKAAIVGTVFLLMSLISVLIGSGSQ